MAAIATPSEIQIILHIRNDYQFISDMIPIVQDTVDRYFGTDFGGVYPVCLKRPIAALIQQTRENPGVVWSRKVGDDDVEYGKTIDLSVIFNGLDDLITTSKKNHGVQSINLRDINNDLGLG
jgi:hypothetical protein